MNENTMPKTKEQKEFETDVQYLLQVLADLPKEERRKVIDFAVFLANE